MYKNMGRQSCCYSPKIRKGLWSPEEDEKLLNHISKYGHGCWSSVPKLAGLQRCGKSCRLRWINYLRPDLKRGAFSEQEENKIIELHSVLGNRWSQIATHLPGRTDNEIKNFWNTSIRKKLKKKGIDPISHKPIPGAAENNTEMLPHVSITENNTEMPSSCPEKMISLLEIGESRAVFCDDRKQKQYYTLEASSSTACMPSGFFGSFSFEHWNYYEPTLCFDSVSVCEKPLANITPSDNASLPCSWGLQNCAQQYSFALQGDTTAEDVDWSQDLQSPPFLVQTESPQPIFTGIKPEMNPSNMECHRDKNFQGSSYAYGNEFDRTSLGFEQHMFLKE